jgi:hypothetical protein
MPDAVDVEIGLPSACITRVAITVIGEVEGANASNPLVEDHVSPREPRCLVAEVAHPHFHGELRGTQGRRVLHHDAVVNPIETQRTSHLARDGHRRSDDDAVIVSEHVRRGAVVKRPVRHHSGRIDLSVGVRHGERAHPRSNHHSNSHADCMFPCCFGFHDAVLLLHSRPLRQGQRANIEGWRGRRRRTGRSSAPGVSRESSPFNIEA